MLHREDSGPGFQAERMGFAAADVLRVRRWSASFAEIGIGRCIQRQQASIERCTARETLVVSERMPRVVGLSWHRRRLPWGRP